jgi:hypothetical protein
MEMQRSRLPIIPLSIKPITPRKHAIVHITAEIKWMETETYYKKFNIGAGRFPQIA